MVKNKDIKYREYMNDRKNCRIVIKDLLSAVKKEPVINRLLKKIIAKSGPVSILVEGSATPENISVLHALIRRRKNDNDRITTIDISSQAIAEHKDYFLKNNLGLKCGISRKNMMNLGKQKTAIDLIVNDFAINFCRMDRENRKTLEEIARVMGKNDSICFLSIVVNGKFDGLKYGKDQEKITEKQKRTPGEFFVLPTKDSETRKCWPVKYYEELFLEYGFSWLKFDERKGKKFFLKPYNISYRRYLLQKK